MNRDLIPQLEPLVERLNSWVGSLVQVTESVSRVPGTYDRHFATTSRFVMRLRSVGMAFSGCSLWLDGEAGGQLAMYEATVDLLEGVSIDARRVVFMEWFGQVAERQSVFELLGEGSA